MVQEPDRATPKAALFGWIFFALLAMLVIPTTFIGGAMGDATDATVLPRVGVAFAVIFALGIAAWLLIGTARALLKPRMSEVQLTILLTLLTLALAFLAFQPAVALVFWFWPTAGR
jgi:hypothetical protein